VFALCALLLRRQIVPHVIALGLFGIALGFAIVTLKTALIGHPVLRFPASGVRSPALSNCARRASTPTVSCCALTASMAAVSRSYRVRPAFGQARHSASNRLFR